MWYEENKKILSELGYYARGQVVLESEEYDLAIVEIGNFPGETHEINQVHLTCRDFSKGEPMHILGSPRGKDLWRWIAGQFVGCERPRRELLASVSRTMYIAATVHPGNSGGPVFDGRGRFAGIVMSRAGETRVYAVPVEALVQGLYFARRSNLIVMTNEENHDVSYVLSWKEGDDVHRYRGIIGRGSRNAFNFYNASNIRIKVSETENSGFYSLESFTNIVYSMSILEPVDNSDREFRVKEYNLKEDRSQLKIFDSGINTYSMDEIENGMEIFAFMKGKVYDSEALRKF